MAHFSRLHLECSPRPSAAPRRGTRFDLSGAPSCGASGGCGPPPSCTATDEEITRDGLGACPAGSRVGSGEASLFLGAAGTLDVNVHQYMAPPALALVLTTDGGDCCGYCAPPSTATASTQPSHPWRCPAASKPRSPASC